MNKIFADSINDYSFPLEENYYNSPNFIDYLKNSHFHHSEKGCVVDMIKIKGDEKTNLTINKECHTHNKTCSKTGWELGFYLGTDNRQENVFVKFCIDCGKEVTTKSQTFKRCNCCMIKAKNKRAKEIEEIRKNKILNYYK